MTTLDHWNSTDATTSLSFSSNDDKYLNIDPLIGIKVFKKNDLLMFRANPLGERISGSPGGGDSTKQKDGDGYKNVI